MHGIGLWACIYVMQGNTVRDSLRARDMIVKQADSFLSAAGIGIDRERCQLTSLPVLLNGYVPSSLSLPSLLLDLATSLQRGSDQEVIRGIAEVSADAMPIHTGPDICCTWCDS